MNDLNTYIEKLELVTFFSAFPLVYLLIQFIATEFSLNKKWIINLNANITTVYPIISLLYIGMKLNQVYQSHFFAIDWYEYNTYLKIWSFTAIIFFIPFFKKKKEWTFIHSIPYVLLIVLDIINYYRNQIGVEVIHNEMRLYFISTILNLLILAFYTLFAGLFLRLFSK